MIDWGGHHFCGMEADRPMLDFRIPIFRDLINNPYIRHDDMTP